MTGPYIITTKGPGDGMERSPNRFATESRLAVATLDDQERPDGTIERGARQAAKTIIIDGPIRYGVDQFIIDTYRLPAEGGTVGPLPDGTVIEVERVDFHTSAGPDHPVRVDALGVTGEGDTYDEAEAAWVAAYNAAQEA